ncbi:MAG: Ig-like domain-containing protein [Candidatus Binatus sp.]|uniref:Ig-like domain-containing protein n=1 Tax=Candidatus Binatus sp. TaxID=2811406 RepID=UPI003D152D16
MTLTMRGTRADAERAFDVRIADYRIGGRTFRANDGDPALPLQLASRVQSITGLSNLAIPSRSAPDSGLAALPAGSAPDWQVTQEICFPFTPTTTPAYVGILEALYLTVRVDAAPLFTAACVGFLAASGASYATCAAMAQNNPSIWQNVPQCNEFFNATSGSSRVGAANNSSTGPDTTLGKNPQKIGLLEFDTLNPSDVQDWLEVIGSGANFGQLSVVPVEGGVATPGAGEPEVLLDVDTVMLLAPTPDTSYVVYDAPNGTSFGTMFSAMIDDGDTVISNSWSECEDQMSLADAQSIDTVLQSAAAGGISVFNGSGDSGTTCLDGSANTVGVPADSPHATAVGGSSPVAGPGLTYESETWWNGVDSTPPTGQGGFGVSTFFAAPSYQSGLSGSTMRSIPDVVVDADPAIGLQICQADTGGCLSGRRFGGTSMAAPEWAAYAAALNAMLGSNLGNANVALYPLAGTNAFHSAASMGSDFAHVGLGSPDLPQLRLGLTGLSPGAASPSLSTAAAAGANADASAPADGATIAVAQTVLTDANGFPLGGKSVSLSASAGSATITPPSAVTDHDGAAVFSITDLNTENLTLTATDTTDSVTLAQKASLSFVPPPATSAGIVASLSTEPADGSTADTITVTLTDSLGRPTPGKVVALDQGSASSVITVPSPAVTGSNGEIQFAVTDIHTETVAYTATDVTDGNLPVPGSAPVDFTDGAGGCASASYVTGTANPAPGYQVSGFATGFFVSAGNQGFSYNCFGAYGMAWDAAGNMYVTDWPTGNIYKFGTSGGVADASHLFTTVQAPATGLAIDPAGNMFASEGSVSGANGDIVPVALSTGTVGSAIASGIPCLGNMAIDPAIPALYVDDFCSSGPVNPNIWQVTGIDGTSPSTTVYAQTPDNFENFNLAVAPDGTVYDAYAAATGAPIARITAGSPPTVTTLTAGDGSLISLTGGLGMTAGGMQADGDSQFLIAPFNPQANALSSPDEAVWSLDLTGSAPTPGLQLTTNDFSGLSNFAIGPDGCLYVAGGPTVSRVTRSDGSCGFGPTTQPPTVSLTPATVSPNPAQGSPVTLTASVHFATVPTGTPVNFQITGANPQSQLANTNSNGNAILTYTGAHQGTDAVIASTTVSSSPVTSNQSVITWGAGSDVTFLTLNASPTSGPPAQAVTVSANLTDVSANPLAALAGKTVNFTLGTGGCGATTDSSGNATCEITPSGIGPMTLAASFPGTSQYNPSSDSKVFTVVVAPVAGKLKVSPKALNFGDVEVNDSKVKTVTITNEGKVTTKKKKGKTTTTTPPNIFIEMESGVTSPFSISQACNDDSLGPKSKGVKAGTCKVSVTFTPTAAIKYLGTMQIQDNLEPSFGQAVKLEGSGKAAKK